MQREPIGFSHPLLSRIRSVQWPDGADHELFLALLCAGSNPIGYGAAQYPGHGVRVVYGFEFQLGALDILLEQAQPFQATACTLTNELN